MSFQRDAPAAQRGGGHLFVACVSCYMQQFLVS